VWCSYNPLRGCSWGWDRGRDEKFGVELGADEAAARSQARLRPSSQHICGREKRWKRLSSTYLCKCQVSLVEQQLDDHCSGVVGDWSLWMKNEAEMERKEAWRTTRIRNRVVGDLVARRGAPYLLSR
jgi:hypothetical protein